MGRECKRLVNQMLDMRLKTLIVITATGVFLLFAGIYYKTTPSARKSHDRIGAVYSSQNKESDRDPEVLVKDKIDLKGFDRKEAERPKTVLAPDFSPQRSLEGKQLLAHVPPGSSIFQVNSMPEDRGLWPLVGNGHIATVVDSSVLYLNGVYRGRGAASHRAAIPALTSIQVSVTAPSVRTRTSFSLDTGQGMFNETTVGPFFSITKLTYAHRTVKELFVVELKIHVHDHPTREALVLKLRARAPPHSVDIDFKRGVCDIPVVQCSYISGRVREAEFPDVTLPSVHVYWTDIPDNITMADGMMEETSLTYLMSISRDAATAKRMFDYGLRINQRIPLRRSHMAEWASLWKQGSVDIDGDTVLAQASYASLYYMLSYLPLRVDATWSHSLLASGGLQQSDKDQPVGHVTGDSERWVFPAMVLLHSNISSSLLHYRLGTLTAAREHANKLQHSGALYPSETAFSGRDVAHKSGDQNRFHVTGDIAVALRYYMWLTKDSVFLSGEKVAKFVLAIAEFWESVLTADAIRDNDGVYAGNRKSKSYSIKDVRPPGRLASGTVTNSLYTNSVAKASLSLPKLLLPSTYEPVVSKYSSQAEGIKTLYDKTLQYLPAYQGYTQGTFGCRDEDPEVILRDVQFSSDVSDTVQKNNLKIYGRCLSQTDSPLLMSAFTTKYLAVKDRTNAERAFNRSLEFIKGPFKVWSEDNSKTGRVRFVPGMASFLHSVLYGFAGFRIEQHQLTFDPVLPRGVSKFTIHQLDYLGQSLTFVFTKLSTNIILEAPPKEAVKLVVNDLVTDKVHYFRSKNVVVLKPLSKGSVARDLGLKINSV